MPIKPEFRHFYRGEAWQSIRATIRERAGNKCERCGVANGAVGFYSSPLKSFFIELSPEESEALPDLATAILPGYTVIQCGCAHLDGDPSNSDPSNLMWLCRRCHLEVDHPLHLTNARKTRCATKDARRPLLGGL